MLGRMSRAFVKEDRAEAPLVVPRVPLPEGTTNYVTARGLALLREELAALETERARHLATGEGDAGFGERIADLEARVGSAVLVDPRALSHDEVRFSARVTLRSGTGVERRYRIVGVDEAEPSSGRIAFIAPLARSLLGRRLGDVVALKSGGVEDEFEIAVIDYEPET